MSCLLLSPVLASLESHWLPCFSLGIPQGLGTCLVPLLDVPPPSISWPDSLTSFKCPPRENFSDPRPLVTICHPAFSSLLITWYHIIFLGLLPSSFQNVNSLRPGAFFFLLYSHAYNGVWTRIGLWWVFMNEWTKKGVTVRVKYTWCQMQTLPVASYWNMKHLSSIC